MLLRAARGPVDSSCDASVDSTHLLRLSLGRLSERAEGGMGSSVAGYS